MNELLTSIIDNKTVSQIYRKSYVSDELRNISKIYLDEINISIWQRQLNRFIMSAAEYIFYNKPNLTFSKLIQVREIKNILFYEFGESNYIPYLVKDISKLVNSFCNLFDLKYVWLRIDSIDHPMCPRFHVDKVKCRLITTYLGPSMEFLPHHLVDRSKLGIGNQGKSDSTSGLYKKNTDIKRLDPGYVALLKGTEWPGNKKGAIVHRSPKSECSYKRLYLRIDFPELYS